MTSFSTGGDIPERSVGTAIAEKTLRQARGHHQDFCVGEEPKRAYYISNLTPPEEDDSDGVPTSEIRPDAVGVDFQPTNDEFPVTVNFEVYYQTYPTYEEYQQLTSDDLRGVDAKLGTTQQSRNPSEKVQSSAEPVSTPDDAYGLDEEFYRRVDIEVHDTIHRQSLAKDAADLTQKIHRELDQQLTDAANITLPTTEILDPTKYDEDLSALTEDRFVELRDSLPTGSIDDLVWPVEFTAREVGSEIKLRLQIRSFDERFEIPGSDETPKLLWDPERDERTPEEECVFNPVIETEGDLTPYELDLMPEDYRFDQQVWAKGHNCSTHTESLSDASGQEETASSVASPFRITTTAVPTASVYEFEFRTDHDTRFLSLAGLQGEGTVDTLREIADGMDEYYTKWKTTRKSEFEKTHSEEEVEAFLEDAKIFNEVEIDRFRSGIRMLAEDDEARRAFQLMNRVNHRVHAELADDEGFKEWRLFQLVFIVSNLPDIVARDPDPARDQFETEFMDDADVLWFPTGGGKTEAYVGIVLSTLFFDRIRGKDRGVSAWIRFPLRLLSSQQKSRFLKSLLVAEQYRVKQSGDNSSSFGLDGAGDEFSLGFFVGGQDTPNAIDDDQRSLFEDRHDAVERACRALSACPLCGSHIELEFDKTRNLVEHHCTGDECIGRLPLYVVDHDIYRYLPSVLLGSLDKVSVMGFQPRFANIFGNLTTQCSVHGIGYSGSCPEKDICSQPDSLSDINPGTRADRDAEFFDPIPSLHLIDEVHLLNEELGTFAGHYETAYLELCEMASEWQDRDEPSFDGGVKPKVLTSTATISKYQRQIRNLLQKEAVRFPQDGPALRETYYGELNEKKVEREYGGITPNNRTHLYAIMDFVKRYHEIIRDYYDADPDELIRDTVRAYYQSRPEQVPNIDLTDESDLNELIGDLDWTTDFDQSRKDNVLDKYETSLVYFTNKREKDTFRNNIGKQIADEMEAEGYESKIQSEQLTADTQGTGVLDELLDPAGDFEDRPDTIPCTSFVGHGIDNPRFNLMIFFGYPSQTFQYIQASSRVGRQSDVPGFVVDFFRPFDLRDRHRFKYFETLHQHLERTVEPVAIDRWAKFGAEHTHPGIVKSILIQYYRPKYYWHTDKDGEFTTIPNNAGEEQRLNVQSARHFYQIMNEDTDFPEVTRKQFVDLVLRLYGTNKADRPVDHIENLLEEKTRRIWDIWNEQLNREMRTPGFPGEEGPMRNLRNIGGHGTVSPFDDTEDFIDALVGGDY